MVTKRFFIFLTIMLAFSFTSVAMAGTQTPSGLTGGDIVTAARYKLGAISASAVTDPFYSATEMIRWVNDGLYDMCKKTGALQEVEDETLVADTYEYALTNLYFEVVGVILNKADGTILGLKKGNIWSVGETKGDFKPEAQRVPGYWYEFDGKIGVYPAYSAVTTETISVYQSIIPAIIAAGDALVTPGYLDKALILYVEAQGHKKAGNAGAYKAAMEEYEAELAIVKIYNSQADKAQEIID